LNFSCGQGNFTLDKVNPYPDEKTNTNVQKINFLTQVINKHPQVADYYYRRAKLYLALGKENQAFPDIQKAVNLNPTQTDYLFALAQIYTVRNEPKNALTIAEKAESRGFKHEGLYRMLGKIYYQEGDFKKSKRNFERLETLIPVDAEVFYFKGLLAAQQQDTSLMVLNLQKAIEQKYDYKEAYLELIHLYKNYGAFLKAREYNRTAMQKINDDAVLYFEYGEIMENIHKKDSALFFYEKSFTFDDKMWKAYHQTAWIYFQDRKFEQAKIFLDKCVNIRPQYRASNYLLGVIHEYRLADLEKAQKYYETALETAPEDLALQKAVRRVKWKIHRATLPKKYQKDTTQNSQ
jgi:tetratricopeptide (TPR) repeat protein